MKNKLKIALLLITCILLVGCDKKLSEEDIKNKLETQYEGTSLTINKVSIAAESININGTDMRVNGDTTVLGNYASKSNVKNHKQITGYYDETTSTYHIYRLSENNDGDMVVSETTKNEENTFNGISWITRSYTNVTDLVKVECNETDDYGQTKTISRIYAVINNELELLG